MSKGHLFQFGYETPDEFRSNLENGTDFESWAGVWINSYSEKDAIEWGQTIAENFVVWLFNREGLTPYSWVNSEFANWIEKDPRELLVSANLPAVSTGEMPDFLQMIGGD